MPTIVEIDVKCPRCGDPARCRVADTVSASRAPELRRAILDRTFHAVRCAGCELEFVVEKHLLYDDFDRGHWIGVFPGADEERFAECEELVLQSFREAMFHNAAPVLREWAPQFKVRVVFSIVQLREKLLCWDAGVDDQVLELTKLDLIGERPELIEYGVKSLCLEAVTPDGWVFSPVRYTPYRDARIQGMVVPRAVIDRVAATVGELRQAHAPLWERPYVSIQRYLTGLA